MEGVANIDNINLLHLPFYINYENYSSFYRLIKKDLNPSKSFASSMLCLVPSMKAFSFAGISISASNILSTVPLNLAGWAVARNSPVSVSLGSLSSNPC